jgi:hypothetical protein
MATVSNQQLISIFKQSMLLTLNYQMPKPMSTIPIANHPSTPTEMIASSVMRELEGLGFGFESESAGFMTSGEIQGCQNDRRSRQSKVCAFIGAERNH